MTLETALSEWQPIETAPKYQWVIGWLGETETHGPGVELVAYIKHNHIPIEGWCYRNDGLGSEEVSGCPPPTHWMPLPEPPELST